MLWEGRSSLQRRGALSRVMRRLWDPPIVPSGEMLMTSRNMCWMPVSILLPVEHACNCYSGFICRMSLQFEGRLPDAAGRQDAV
jgi:hypothetical protein